jgi:hypothetical protein
MKLQAYSNFLAGGSGIAEFQVQLLADLGAELLSESGRRR